MKNILFCLAVLATACVAQDVGHVENFAVSESGNGSITLSWDFVEGAFELHKYSLIIDSDLTSEFKCSAAYCTKIIYDLESCVEHVFDLKPIFYDTTGANVDGEISTTSGYTEDEIPGPVSNIVATVDPDEKTTLTWSEPIENVKCAAFYTVCLRLDGESDKYCVQSNTTKVTIINLSACGNYHVEVTPVTPSFSEGLTAEDVFQTPRGVPGEPQDVKVGLITQDTIQLLWNNPVENILCLDKFLITIGETHTLFLKSSELTTPSGFDNEFTFTPLSPCTGYVIDVCSANVEEQTSDKVVRYASTEETEPLPPPTVTVTPNGPDSIHVSWGENENDRCSGSFEVCWIDFVHPYEECENVAGGGDNGLIINDLLPCSNYEISVIVQSPNGTFSSNSTTSSTSTADVRPDPVVDLRFQDITTNELTISYLSPDTNPQCVKEVITRVTDNNQRLRRKKSMRSAYEETFTGLAACTQYTVQVSTVSPTGFESPVEEITNTTLNDLTSAPQELGANYITDTSITLQWFQPAINPRCVTDYTLTWTGLSTENVTINASTFKVVYTVEGLTPCTSYDFTLIAQSVLGPSPQTSYQDTTLC